VKDSVKRRLRETAHSDLPDSAGAVTSSGTDFVGAAIIFLGSAIAASVAVYLMDWGFSQTVSIFVATVIWSGFMFPIAKMLSGRDNFRPPAPEQCPRRA
jgi:hypothetical protein